MKELVIYIPAVVTLRFQGKPWLTCLLCLIFDSPDKVVVTGVYYTQELKTKWSRQLHFVFGFIQVV